MSDPHWIGWTAGIIDGEGTITISPRKRTDEVHRYDGFSVCVIVGNTDLNMLIKLQELWGGSIGKMFVDKRKNRAPAWRWFVSALKAHNVLLEIKDFLVTKKQQAILAIELQERISQHLGIPGNIRKNGISEDEIILRNNLFVRMKELNIKPGVKYVKTLDTGRS